jgi:hypothetical protein
MIEHVFGVVAAPEVQPVDAAVDDLLALDVDNIDDRALSDAVVELRRVQARLAAVHARLVDRVERRRPWALEQYRTTASWLADSDNTSVEDARHDVRLARRLRTMPATAAALAAGDISVAHALRLASLNAPDTAAAFADAEDFLVGQARTMRWPDFTKALAYWLRLARDDDPDPDKADHERRHVSLHDGLRGTGVLTGELAAVDKATFGTALDRIEKELFDADWADTRARLGDAATAADLARTPRQRRHDALIEMAVRATTASADGKRPRPLVSILTGYDAFADVCELADGTVISPGTVASMLSEADIERVVYDGPSRVVDLGRTRGFVGAARRAVELQHHRCTGRGCLVSADKCQIDHVRRYADGGITRPDNGEPKCGFHNRARERAEPPPSPPPDLTPEQAEARLELLLRRIRDRRTHDPTWTLTTEAREPSSRSLPWIVIPRSSSRVRRARVTPRMQGSGRRGGR